ncbi:MAG: class I SAM-dependent methyltransferase [Tepidisphaeraceae bacterium]|jgi:SAM-dependent methyltransferase
MSKPLFDDLTDLYEALIDWPKRLANEAPFFRRLFEQSNVTRVADVACGTGRHADMFRSWGLEVHGSDISPNMIQRAKEAFGESDHLRWKIQGFEHPIGPPGFFDAVVCIGNSLALAPDAMAAAQALRHMLGALRPGGLAIVQVLNLWKLPQGPCVWQKIIRKSLAQGESLVLKGVHRCADRGYVDLVVIGNAADNAPIRSRSVPFLGLKSQDLEAIARESGAVDVTFFGNHQDQPYDAPNSMDLIMVAKKGNIES